MSLKRGSLDSTSSRGRSEDKGNQDRNHYFKFKSDKKGQVTVFIIAGILLLFAFAGILYLTQSTTETTVMADGETIVSTVPQEFRPLQQYTENCLQQIGKRGLLILGQQGGYIYPEVLGEFSATDPTDADGLNLDPLKVPYWNYNKDPNQAKTITHATLRPELTGTDENSIESQLRRFVKENIAECLDTYQVFSASGFTIAADSVKDVEVSIGEQGVNFLLTMPLEAQRGSSKTTLNKFAARIPLQLKHYYDVASTVLEAEQKYSFLEKQGLELLAIYSRNDKDYFPPTSGVTYDLFSPLSWSEVTLEGKMKELLTSYVQMLRYLGSENFQYSRFPSGNLLAQKEIDNMVLPLLGADDLSINFDYFGWKLYFKTNSEEGLIKPEHMFVSYWILNFGMQRYETHYDVSYPVLVTLTDESALYGEGYNFVFALESNIRNNEPSVSGSVKESYPRKITSLACNDDQKDSPLVKSIVVDSFTKEPVEMVKIGFSIPNQVSCDVGVTDKNGKVESKLPLAYGGVMNFIHPEYLTALYPLDTAKYQNIQTPLILGQTVAGIEEQKVIEIHRLKTINVTIRKKELEKCVVPLVCEYTESGIVPIFAGLSILPYRDISCAKGTPQCFYPSAFFGGEPVLTIQANQSLSQFNDYYFTNSAQSLGENEEALLTLQRVADSNPGMQSNDFVVTVAVQGDTSTSVQLVPGMYKVNGVSTLKEKITFPAEQRCFNYNILSWEKQECFHVNESIMDSYITGNMQWDTPETYLMITPEQLYSATNLTLYFLTQDITSVTPEITTTAKQCHGFACLPGAGCAFSDCETKTVLVAGRILEDSYVPSKIVDVAKVTEIRKALEPVFN